MSHPFTEIEKRYAVALQRYLAEPEESALLEAYEIGRQALAEGLGVLEMATVHSSAIAGVLNRSLPKAERTRLLEGQLSFFVEALSPFEMAHRGFREANSVLRQMNEMMEGQAKRIASALHDEAAQLLASVHLSLAEAARELPARKAKPLAKVQGLLNEIEVRLRNLSHELRPSVLEDFGLLHALESLADGVSRRWGLPVTVKGSLKGNVPGSVETTVYRIAQEALTNAAKHAKATRAEVDVEQTVQGLICSVRDDGIGMEASASTRVDKSGIGLREMKERVTALGGIMRMGTNKDDRGTDLTFEIPLES